MSAPADDSSPLSSPPRSVINVALGSPLVHNHGTASPSGSRESVIESPVEAAECRPLQGPSQDDKAIDSDEGSQPSSQKRKSGPTLEMLPAKKPRRVAAAPRKSAQDKKWEAPFVYTDSRSPLAQADLRAILLLPEAWEVLTQEERQDVLAKFPDDTHILNAGTPDARPDPVSLRNDDNFRHDCARYCENLELGRYDEEWLSQAWIAHEKHRRGDFDSFLRRQFEDYWETQLPDDDQAEAPAMLQESKAEPASPSKQVIARPAEPSQPALGTGDQGPPAPVHPSKQTSLSPDSAGGSQNLSDEINNREENPATHVSINSSSSHQPINPPRGGSDNRPGTSANQEEAKSAIVARAE